MARAVADGECERGILICGTGIGISISANKVKGIRAALCGDCYSAEMTRRHNDANILAMGARVLGPGRARKIVGPVRNPEFEGGRPARRRGRGSGLGQPRGRGRPARVLGPGLALKIVETFLSTAFEGGRHARRIALISDIENRG